MALHEVPDDGQPHTTTSECECGPQRREGITSTARGLYQGVRYVHRARPAPAATDDDYDNTFGGAQ